MVVSAIEQRIHAFRRGRFLKETLSGKLL